MNQLVVMNGAAREQDLPRKYLSFLLGTESFGIDILCIREIIEYAGVTEVPMMPASIRGVINLRGAVVPVMDLAVRFGRPAAAVTKRTCIVIVEAGDERERMVVGVLVDAVNSVLDIAAADVEPAPAFGSRVHKDFLHGIGKVNGKFVLLLDTTRILSIEDMENLQDASLALPQD